MTVRSPNREMASRNLVFFLGAGFSWDAVLPLMRSFGDQSVRSQPGVDTHSGPAGPMLREAKKIYGAFRDWCRQSEILSSNDWNNLEDVLGVAEVLRQAGVPAVPLANGDCEIDRVRRALRLWIWKTYHQLPVKRDEPPRLRPPNRKPYQDLIAELDRLRLLGDTTIVTTNYDIVVEYFCFLNRTRARYPVDWDRDFRAGHGTECYVAPSASVPEGPLLCKLHGSINFFEHSNDPKAGMSVAADLGGKEDGSAFEDEPAIVAVDAVHRLQAKYGEDLTPAIVPPTYTKLQDKDWLRQTWDAALRALAKAEAVVFIGYSMPPSDGFMRGLLTAAGSLGKPGDRPEVLVVDTCAEVRTRFEDLYGRIDPGDELSFADAMAGPLPEWLERFANR